MPGGVVLTVGLRRCPLCGGEARLLRGKSSYVVECPCSEHVFHQARRSAAKSVALWNGRADGVR